MLLPDDRCPAANRIGHEKFCPIALTDWLAGAQKAGIPHVPGTTVATFEREDLRNHEYHGPHQARLDKAFAEAAPHGNDSTMMRWDCCASGNLKMALSDGKSAIPASVRNGLPVDARLLSILENYPRTTLGAIVRPWVTDGLSSKGYPVEYRAYVTNGSLTGISSYYPQRPLRRMESELEAVQRMTKALIAVVEGPFDWPVSDSEAMSIRHQMLGEDEKRVGEAVPDPRGSTSRRTSLQPQEACCSSREDHRGSSERTPAVSKAADASMESPSTRIRPRNRWRSEEGCEQQAERLSVSGGQPRLHKRGTGVPLQDVRSAMARKRERRGEAHPDTAAPGTMLGLRQSRGQRGRRSELQAVRDRAAVLRQRVPGEPPIRRARRRRMVVRRRHLRGMPRMLRDTKRGRRTPR